MSLGHGWWLVAFWHYKIFFTSATLKQYFQCGIKTWICQISPLSMCARLLSNARPSPIVKCVRPRSSTCVHLTNVSALYALCTSCFLHSFCHSILSIGIMNLYKSAVCFLLKMVCSAVQCRKWLKDFLKQIRPQRLIWAIKLSLFDRTSSLLV